MSGITHVVLVQWTDRADRAAEADGLCQEHLTRIDGVVSVVSGPSVSPEGKEGAYDWMLVVRFRDRAALEGYLPHEEHQPVGTFIGGAASDVVVFDVDEG